jgi:flagellar biosynthesis protein FlhG
MVKGWRQLDGVIGEPARTLAQGEILGFISGKPGVGKSTLAINSGIQLSRYGYRTALLRASSGFTSADVLPNVSPLKDVSAPFRDRLPVDHLPADGREGLRVLCGMSGLARGAGTHELGPSACERAPAGLDGACNVLLIDCPAGATSPVAAYALASDSMIVVTTPEPSALADAYATLKMLCSRGFRGRAGVVLNMVQSGGEAQRALGRLRRASERFLGLALENLGHVPLDRHVMRAARERVPVVLRYPGCSASCCIDEICTRIVAAGSFADRQPGLWARAARLFL